MNVFTTLDELAVYIRKLETRLKVFESNLKAAGTYQQVEGSSGYGVCVSCCYSSSSKKHAPDCEFFTITGELKVSEFE